MIEFYWYDIALIPGIAQGIFLSLMVLRIENRNIRANRVLAVILLMAVVMLVGRMVYVRYPADWLYQWTLIPDTTIFFFGPLTYSYIRKLLYNDGYKLNLWHFLPATIHLAVVAVFFAMDQSLFATWWNASYIPRYLMGVEGSAILLNFIYWYWSYHLIARYQKQKKDKITFEQQAVSYLTYFHWTMLVCLVLWVFSFVEFWFLRSGFYFINYDWIWVTIPVCIYIVGYYALKQPDIFKLQTVQTEGVRPKLKVNRLKEQEIEWLREKLQDVVNDKIHLQNDLTLAKLSNEIDTSTNNVSWFLNEVHGKTFYDYINSLRIAEFQTRIANQEHLKKTLLALAMEVGFNSKSTFNKAFKEALNTTPSEYVKGMQQETTIENRELSKVG